MGSGGLLTMGSGGTLAMGSGGTLAMGSGGASPWAAAAPSPWAAAAPSRMGSGGTLGMGSGGTSSRWAAAASSPWAAAARCAMGSGGTFALGSGGTLAFGSGGTLALGSGGTLALGSGGTLKMGSGGVMEEMTYETANSVVRPPSEVTKTPTTVGGLRIDWEPPSFGVVSEYHVYYRVGTGAPVSVGTVSGDPPQTTFTVTSPVADAVYFVTTTVADSEHGAPQQSTLGSGRPEVRPDDHVRCVAGQAGTVINRSRSALTASPSGLRSQLQRGRQLHGQRRSRVADERGQLHDHRVATRQSGIQSGTECARGRSRFWRCQRLRRSASPLCRTRRMAIPTLR